MQTLVEGITDAYWNSPALRARKGYRKFMAPMYPTPQSKRSRKLSWSTRSTGSSTRSGMRSLRRAMSLSSSAGSRGSLVHDNTVTAQHDYKTQYKYRRAPRYKKKAWRRFSKKVAAVNLKNAGLRTVVINSRGTGSNAPGAQGKLALALYGVAGSVDTVGLHGHNDLYRVFKGDPDIVQIGAAPGNVPKSGKLQFGSAVLDYTIRNLSVDLEMELDIYMGYYKKDDDASLAKVNTNPIFKYDNAPTDAIGGGTPFDLGTRGTTLFDKPAGISATGFHIIKKQKMLLQPGESTFLQHRDYHNHMVDWTNIQDVGYCKRNLTYGVWLVFKPSVTASDDAVVTIGVGVTRKYSYAVLDENVDRISYNPPN